MSINLSDEARNFLADLTARRGISYTEAVRQALALLKYVDELYARGERLQIDDDDTIRWLVYP